MQGQTAGLASAGQNRIAVDRPSDMPAAIPTVSNVVTLLHTQVDDLHQLAAGIEERFGVILRPNPPQPAVSGATGQAAQPASEMLCALNALSESLERLRDRMADFRRRADL